MFYLFSLTDQGQELALRLQTRLQTRGVQTELHHKTKPFTDRVQQVFQQAEQKQDALIFICATGIVMRSLAPVLQDKYQDAPVLVLDEQGRFVIPFLSGHEGGANHLAAQIAELLQATPVITTANHYLNPVYTVGMGCERHCPRDELQGLLESCLQRAGLTMDQIQSINSIDIKADEVGLIELGKSLNKPFNTWHKDQLNIMDHLLSTRSDYIFKTVGVYGVAESAALYGARQLVMSSDCLQDSSEPTSDTSISELARTQFSQPELLLNKQKTRKATCAIARIYPPAAATVESGLAYLSTSFTSLQSKERD